MLSRQLCRKILSIARVPIPSECAIVARYITCGCGEKIDASNNPGINGVFCPACGKTLEPSTPTAEAATGMELTTMKYWKDPAAVPVDVLPADAAEGERPRTQKEIDEEFKRYIEAQRAKEAKPTTTGGGFFGPEKAGIQAGVLGGLLMMGGATVWFVLGLMCDRIFFYPPILFVIGVIALIRGIITGNIAGEKSKG